MDPKQELEWAEAQKIAVSVDLVAAAKRQLQFLAAVDKNRDLYDGPVLERAIYRYKHCWLPFLDKHSESDITNGPLIVPLDTEWIWHCHRLNPVQYKTDCEQLFGKILDNSRVVSQIQGICSKKTEEMWTQMFPNEPYNISLINVSAEGKFEKISEPAKCTKYDLVSAVKRQSPFFYQVSRPHMHNKIFLEEAVNRYKGFLHLIKRNKEMDVKRFCVPTYDIDLIWHTHQLHPVAYCHDLNKALGKVLEHDDTDADRAKGKKLDVGFSGTTKQWEDTFGTSYWKAGAMYRGNAPSPVTSRPCSFGLTTKDTAISNEFPKEIHLQEKKLVEVFLEFVDVKNLPEGHKGSLSVTFSKSQPDAFFGVTRKLSILSESGEKKVASFQCEPTGSLLFELTYHPSKLSLTRASRTLGSASLSLQEYLSPVSKLSDVKWLQLQPVSGLADAEPILLQVSVSFTVPVQSPYVLRLTQPPMFSKISCLFPQFGRKGLPESFTHFIDSNENDTEVVSLQMRELKAMDKCIPKKEVIGLVVSGETFKLAEFVNNEWSLLNSQLSFRKISIDEFDEGPLFELKGSRTVKLFRGRKLDYEPGFNEKHSNEADFLTAVEFSEENPYGVAVALFDLKSGYLKAKSKWMVLPGITLGFILSDMFRNTRFSMTVKNEDQTREELEVKNENNAMSENNGLSNCGKECGDQDGKHRLKGGGCGGCGAGSCGVNSVKMVKSGGCGAGCGGGCGNIVHTGGCGGGRGGGGCGSLVKSSGCGAGCGGSCGNIVQSGGCGGSCGGSCGNVVKSSGCGGCGAGCGDLASGGGPGGCGGPCLPR